VSVNGHGTGWGIGHSGWSDLPGIPSFEGLCMYIQAIGTQRETGDGTQPSGIPLRVGVAIGAQLGTVG